METGLEYKVFEWLRFPLIVGVVFIHCFGKPFDYGSLDFSSLTSEDIYNLFRVSISKVLAHVCVPSFYFISGYLFFKGLEKWNTRTYKEKILRRTKSLLIPYLIWNTIYILLVMFSLYRHHGVESVRSFIEDNGYWHLYWDCNEWNLERLNWIGRGNLSSSPYLFPLWFLRDLMVVIICSPLLYLFLRKLKEWGIYLLAVCYISGVFIDCPGFSETAFFFFGLGAYNKMNNINFLQDIVRYQYVLLPLSILLWFICTLLNGHHTTIGNIIYPVYVIVGSFALLNVAIIIVNRNIMRIPKILIQSSFFIYLSHTIVITNLCMMLTSVVFGDNIQLYMAMGYITAPILTITVCILFYYILYRCFPKICYCLTGGR